MTTTGERYAMVIEELYELTLAKKIEWEIDSDNEVKCALSKYFISLDQTEDAEGAPYISVKIRDGQGSIIDRFNDNDLANQRPNIAGKTSYWQIMLDLIHQAGRQATGADDALDQIIQDLQNRNVPF